MKRDIFSEINTYILFAILAIQLVNLYSLLQNKRNKGNKQYNDRYYKVDSISSGGRTCVFSTFQVNDSTQAKLDPLGGIVPR